MSPSLGKKLKRVLEREGTGTTRKPVDVHFKRDLEIVEAFYADVKKNITREINAGKPIRPIKMSATGGYHDIFWIFHLPQAKPVALDRADNAFRRQWDDFLRWAADNDLKVDLFFHGDSKVLHDYWFEISIQPAL